MATFLIDLSPAELARRLGDALNVYVTAMGYPPGTEQHRAGMWLEHTQRAGWHAVAAVQVAEPSAPGGTPSAAELDAAPLLGIGYGYRGAPDQWWCQQVLLGLHRRGVSRPDGAALMNDYFELTELHIRPHAQGLGLGEALTRRLLGGRPEARVLLSTPEISAEDNRAWRLYRRLGFADVVRGHYFAGDPRAFAILGRPLPLETAHPAS